MKCPVSLEIAPVRNSFTLKITIANRMKPACPTLVCNSTGAPLQCPDNKGITYYCEVSMGAWAQHPGNGIKYSIIS